MTTSAQDESEQWNLTPCKKVSSVAATKTQKKPMHLIAFKLMMDQC